MRDRVDTPPARGGESSALDGAGRTVLMVDDDP
ncbi:DNA-binding response regulator, partial [Enterococcus faecium]